MAFSSFPAIFGATATTPYDHEKTTTEQRLAARQRRARSRPAARDGGRAHAGFAPLRRRPRARRSALDRAGAGQRPGEPVRSGRRIEGGANEQPALATATRGRPQRRPALRRVPPARPDGGGARGRPHRSGPPWRDGCEGEPAGIVSAVPLVEDRDGGARPRDGARVRRGRDAAGMAAPRSAEVDPPGSPIRMAALRRSHGKDTGV